MCIYQFITIDGRTAIVRIQQTFSMVRRCVLRTHASVKIQMTFDARGPAMCKYGNALFRSEGDGARHGGHSSK